MTHPPVMRTLRQATLGTFLGILLVMQHELPVSQAHAPCVESEGSGQYANLVVYEGYGLAKVDFGFSPADVEATLGPAEGGSENHLKYDSSGLSLCFCGGNLKDIHFRSPFRGSLDASGLGIGSALEEVIAAYGEIKEEKVVSGVCGWTLDRVLLVKKDRQPTDERAYKLCYYEVGLCFVFGAQGLASEFVVFEPRGT